MLDFTRPKGKDDIFVKQLVEGSEAAFQKLFELYRDDIYTYSRSLVRSESMAEEIVQEVFLRLWMNAGSLDPKLSLRSYLFTIARNLSFDFLRKAANSRKLSEEIFYSRVEVHNTTQDAMQNAEYDLIKEKALETLPPKRRRIYEMSRNEGKSYEDISRELGISISTVKGQMSKALLSLRKYLQLHTDLTFLLVFLVKLWTNNHQ